MRLVDIIRSKRDGAELGADQIRFLVDAYTRGAAPDYQVAAWLMAVVLRGMTRAETAALTEAMLRSGAVLDLSGLSGRKVDKHSTGGVGDKTSLVLAPLVAAGGVVVPMISGRGLGHTGGTLDKLEAIPGFNVNLSVAEMRRVLERCGCAMLGQTAEIAPADKKMYALRDVTATVESPALICASIMSKKLAEGIDALVLDVKTGGGAFLKEQSEAAHVAELMVETGERMGTRVVALLTGMDEPLGRKVGNALETEECIELMRGEGPDDLRELTLELAGWMLHLGERAATPAEGKRRAGELLAGGAALQKFRELVALQGGDAAVADDPARLPHARHTADVLSPAAGVVQSMDCEQLGWACVVLGGGRDRKEDAIDPAVGLVLHKKVGQAAAAGEPLCTVHYNDAARLAEAQRRLQACWSIGPAAPPRPPLVRQVILRSQA